jgi:hypothetical protein
MDAAQKKALQALAKGRSKAEVTALFALVRAKSDRALLAAALPAKKKPAKKADTLARDLDKTLRPILGPVSEKADLLVEHMAAKHKKKLDLQPKGLAAAARELRAHFTDAQIRAGAKSLLTELAKLYSTRETVV